MFCRFIHTHACVYMWTTLQILIRNHCQQIKVGLALNISTHSVENATVALFSSALCAADRNFVAYVLRWHMLYRKVSSLLSAKLVEICKKWKKTL